jgi:hypothetical protein
MPIVRYFLFTASLLLVLLFAAVWYWPPQGDHAVATDIDRSVIRIRSARSVPEKIVFDTNRPTVVSSSTPIHDRGREAEPRDAFAMVAPSLPPGQPAQTSSAGVGRRERHGKRSTRMTQRLPARRLALERREWFGGW